MVGQEMGRESGQGSTLAQEFVQFAIESGVLKFGQFKTKAGRMSPYFFNAGLFDNGAKLGKLAQFYARQLLGVSPNVLNRQFEQATPNQVWVADIIYIRTCCGWLYLAAVLDLHLRRIAGWAKAPQNACWLGMSSVAKGDRSKKSSAWADRSFRPGHTVRQRWTSRVLAKHGFAVSSSRKGNFGDNAVMERFFLNLKMERVWHKDYANHGEATNDITGYIVGFYNSIRPHSKLGNLSPNAFERDSYTIKQKHE